MKNESGKFSFTLLLTILLSVAVIYFVISESEKEKSKTSRYPTHLSIGSIYHINGEGNVGCLEQKQFERLRSFANQEDKEAFATELTVGLLSGSSTQFKNGEQVYLMDRKVFSYLVQIRRKGETISYWTNEKAIKK